MNTQTKACHALVEWVNNNRSVTLSGKLLEAVSLAREAGKAPPQNETSPAEPSPGAMKAAFMILPDFATAEIHKAQQLKYARVIDQHTHATDLLAMVKELRDAAMDTPALDSSKDWTALIEKADALLNKTQP